VTAGAPARAPARARRACAAAASLLASLPFACVACAPERVEYRQRSDFMQDPDAPKEFIAPDGTRVVFVDPLDAAKDKPAEAPKLGPDGKPVPTKVFQPREELEDGTVVLRNLFPDHVVGNTMACMRREEYRLMWDQLLAPETRAQWDRSGGYEGFEAWCKANRKPTMELLNRMRFNAVGSDVAMKQVRPGVMRATLAPHLWDQFQLRVIEFEQTTDGMKLLSIRPAP
jgi:hypothetical protein